MPRTDTVVVGAGVAGLVVARRLALAGESVTVLESSPRVGGRLAALPIAGTALDAGAESFATREGTVATLLAELDLADSIVTPRAGPAWLYRPDGTSAPSPATSFLGIPADPAAADVARAVGAAGVARALQDAALPPGVGADSTTLGQLVRVRMGQLLLDTLVAPVVRGVYSRDADELPLAQVAPTLLDRLRLHGSLGAAVRGLRAQAPAGSLVAGLRGGVFRLAEALADDAVRHGAVIETGSHVAGIAADAVTVAGRRRPGRVILAAPPPDTGTSPPITLVTLVVDAPDLDPGPRGSGLLVVPGSDVAARATTHLSAKWEWIAGALGRSRHAIRLSYDGAVEAPVAAARADARRLFGMPIPAPVDAAVVRWDRPTPDGRRHGIPAVGESVAGSGLAAVVAQAEALAADLLDSQLTATRERMEP